MKELRIGTQYKKYRVFFVGTLFGFMFCTLLGHASETGQTSLRVLTGLDVLVSERSELIAGKKLGIVTNHTACDSQGRHIIDLLAEKAQITALFGPEHGIRGDSSAGENIKDGIDSITGAPIYSLYGKTFEPTPDMLQNVQLMIFDIQDVGARFYTYISTLFVVMEACARHDIPIVVLDRPNPIGGIQVEGPVISPRLQSFVGVAPIAIRHGMTVGELATMFNMEGFIGHRIGANLSVVRCKNWERSIWYDKTGLPWLAPSPNMPSLEAATIYPGGCLIEGANLSEGRGTDTPFVIYGAPWIDGTKWAEALNQEGLSGVQFEPVTFKPRSIPGKSENPKHKDKDCGGIRVVVTDRGVFQPVACGVAMLSTAYQQDPGKFEFRSSHLDRLWGNQQLRYHIEAGTPWTKIMEETQKSLQRFMDVRSRYLLYPE